MATVAIGEWMNPDEPMMKPDSEFVRLKGLMFDPIASITQETRQRLTDLVMRDTDVLFCGSVGAGPFPRLVKHAQV
jgi:hypothetical protein